MSAEYVFSIIHIHLWLDKVMVDSYIFLSYMCRSKAMLRRQNDICTIESFYSQYLGCGRYLWQACRLTSKGNDWSNVDIRKLKEIGPHTKCGHCYDTSLNENHKGLWHYTSIYSWIHCWWNVVSILVFL